MSYELEGGPPPSDLKRRQAAGVEVERKMIEFLMQWAPVRELKVGDVQQIATSARLYAFDAFSPK